MFVLAREATWIWPVRVRYPTDDGHRDGEFRARFRQLTQAQIEGAQATADPVGTMMRNAVVELLDLEDDAGTRLEHSPALLEAVLAIPYIKLGLSVAYVDAVTQLPTKN